MRLLLKKTENNSLLMIFERKILGKILYVPRIDAQMRDCRKQYTAVRFMTIFISMAEYREGSFKELTIMSRTRVAETNIVNKNG